MPVQNGAKGTRVIEFECTRYLLEHESLTTPAQPVLQCSQCHESVAEGLSSEESQLRKEHLGPNSISFQISSIPDLIQAEVCTGFYLYQWSMYQVWMWDTQLIIGLILVSVVIISAVINIWLAHNGQTNIASLCEFSMQVETKRSGEWKSVESSELVPGDIIKVEADWTAPADLAMVRGSAVCDEAGLTGESMPVGKTALPVSAELFNATKHKSSMVYGGTKVLQAGGGEKSERLGGADAVAWS